LHTDCMTPAWQHRSCSRSMQLINHASTCSTCSSLTWSMLRTSSYWHIAPPTQKNQEKLQHFIQFPAVIAEASQGGSPELCTLPLTSLSTHPVTHHSTGRLLSASQQLHMVMTHKSCSQVQSRLWSKVKASSMRLGPALSSVWSQR